MDNNPKTDNQSPEPQGDFHPKSQGGVLHTVIVVFLALLVVLLVSTGGFYFTVNNINGVADSLRPQFCRSSRFKHFCPKTLRL